MVKRRPSTRKVGQLIDVVRRLPEGRDLLDAIDIYCGYKRTVFHADNERQTNFNAGKQAVANWLHEQHNKKVKDNYNEELDA